MCGAVRYARDDRVSPVSYDVMMYTRDPTARALCVHESTAYVRVARRFVRYTCVRASAQRVWARSACVRESGARVCACVLRARAFVTGELDGRAHACDGMRLFYYYIFLTLSVGRCVGLVVVGGSYSARVRYEKRESTGGRKIPCPRFVSFRLGGFFFLFSFRLFETSSSVFRFVSGFFTPTVRPHTAVVVCTTGAASQPSLTLDRSAVCCCRRRRRFYSIFPRAATTTVGRIVFPIISFRRSSHTFHPAPANCDIGLTETPFQYLNNK